MKRKNGFTLVELLAVIVVLAIIMILAIPSVLETMTTARKNAFVLYVDKVVGAVTTQYTYDANGGAIAGAGYYVYDITVDLNLTSTGSYKGYVVVNAMDVDNVKYIVSLYDNNYELINYDVTTNGMPTLSSVNSFRKENAITTPSQACSNAASNSTNCYTRKGYLIVNNKTSTSSETNNE